MVLGCTCFIRGRVFCFFYCSLWSPLIILCLIGAILRLFSFFIYLFFLLFMTKTTRSLVVWPKLHIVQPLDVFPPFYFFLQWLPKISFTSSFSSSSSSLHILYNSFFFSIQKPLSPLFSSHFLTLSNSQTPSFSHFLSNSLHLLEWHPSPRRPPTSFPLMYSTSPARVRQQG